jgi:hypothetical protein
LKESISAKIKKLGEYKARKSKKQSREEARTVLKFEPRNRGKREPKKY